MKNFSTKLVDNILPFPRCESVERNSIGSIPVVALRLQLENDLLLCELFALCIWKHGCLMSERIAGGYPRLCEVLVRLESHLGLGMYQTSQMLVETTAWSCTKRCLRGQNLPEAHKKLKHRP